MRCNRLADSKGHDIFNLQIVKSQNMNMKRNLNLKKKEWYAFENSIVRVAENTQIWKG